MRGVVGSVQDAATAVLSILALSTAYKAANIVRVCQTASVGECEVPDVFLTVVAATLVVTLSCGAIFLLLGVSRLGNLVRFIPYPVVGGSWRAPDGCSSRAVSTSPLVWSCTSEQSGSAPTSETGVVRSW